MLRQEISSRLSGRLTCSLAEIWRSPAVKFDAKCIEAVAAGAAAAGYSSLRLHSGAGHDSAYIARVAPTAMIFIPCLGGLSHNEAESSTRQQCQAGTQTLLNAFSAWTALSESGSGAAPCNGGDSDLSPSPSTSTRPLQYPAIGISELLLDARSVSPAPAADFPSTLAGSGQTPAWAKVTSLRRFSHHKARLMQRRLCRNVSLTLSLAARNSPEASKQACRR